MLCGIEAGREAQRGGKYIYIYVCVCIYIYVYIIITDSSLLHSRNQHNIVKQLSANKKKRLLSKIILERIQLLKEGVSSEGAS